MTLRRIDKIDIVGAGPGGLAAAVVASPNTSVVVSDRHADVGHRFHGDFQGLENWTTDEDVLDELASLGVQSTFEHVPFYHLVVFDPAAHAHEIRSARPLWYLVRRGGQPGTLDYALKEQAEAAGATLTFDRRVEHLPRGGIVAHGPRRADVIAVGYVFNTTRADGAFAVISDHLAPKGYAYLLIHRGRATVATCLFRDFHNEKTYLRRTVEFFQREVGIDASHGQRFGGFGNVYDSMTVRRGNLLYVGEAAGLQDALFGFGMRFAMLSGSFAARALFQGRPDQYDAHCAARFGPLLRLGWTNRFFYNLMGDGGYLRLLNRIEAQRDARAWLRRHYTVGRVRSLISGYARRRLRTAGTPAELTPENCDCTWCKCDTHHPTPAHDNA